MKKENYDTNEYNTFEEYKKFDSIEYFNVDELKSFNKELYEVVENKVVDSYKNETDNKEEKLELKADNEGATIKSSETLIKKIVESTSGIATTITGTVVTATVAVATCSTILVSAPKATISITDNGIDYVSYSIDVTDLNEDNNYYVLLSGKDVDYTLNIPTIGTYSDIISGLKPNHQYNIKLVGDSGEIGGVTTYAEKSFYTLKGADPTACLNFDFYNSNSFGYSCYISDYDNVGSNYYLDILQDGNSYLQDFDYKDSYLKNYLYDIPDGEYTFNVYGNIDDELKLIKTESLYLPYKMDEDYIEDVKIDIKNNKLIISGMFDSSNPNNSLSYKIDFLKDSKIVKTISKDINLNAGTKLVSDAKEDNKSFVIEEDILEDCDTFNIYMYRNGKCIYTVEDEDIDTAPNIKVASNFTYKNLNLLFETYDEFKYTPKYKLTLRTNSLSKEYTGDLVFTNNKVSLDINPEDYEYYDLVITYNDEIINQTTNCLIDYPRLVDGKEIKSLDNYNLSGTVNNTKYKNGKIVFYGDDTKYEEIFTITDNNFNITVAHEAVSKYRYEVYIDKQLAYSSNEANYICDEYVSYDKKTINEANISFIDNKLDIEVPIIFTKLDGYKVRVTLYDNNDNVIDTIDSLGEAVRFSNVELNTGYKLGYENIRVVDSKEYSYGKEILADVLNITLPVVEVTNIAYTDDEAVISYSIDNATMITSLTLAVDVDGVSNDVVVNLTNNPTSIKYAVANTNTTIKVTPKATISVSGITGTYNKTYDEVSSTIDLEVVAIDVSEITAPEKYVISGTLKNNKAASCEVVLVADGVEAKKTATLTDNSFSCTFDVSKPTNYYYIIRYDNDTVISTSTLAEYNYSSELEFEMVSINNTNKSFNQSNKLDIEVPISFTSVDEYKVRVTLYDDDNTVVDSKESTGSSVAFTNLDPNITYKLGYENIRVVDEVEYLYNSQLLDDEFGLDLPALAISEDYKYNYDGSVVMGYSLENNSSYTVSLELDGTGLASKQTVDLSENPTEYKFTPDGKKLDLSAYLIIEVEGISNSYRFEIDPVKKELLQAEIGDIYYLSQITFLYVPLTNYKSSYNLVTYETVDDIQSQYVTSGEFGYYGLDDGEYTYYAAYRDAEENLISIPTKVTFTIDRSKVQDKEYTCDYKNVGDVLVSYNDDGTVNLSIETNFKSLDDSKLYIKLNNEEKSERFVVEEGNFNLTNYKVEPGDYRGITYEISYMVDDIRYVCNDVPVSGTIVFNGVTFSNVEKNLDIENKKFTISMDINDLYDINPEVNISFNSYDNKFNNHSYTSSEYTYEYKDGKLTATLNLIDDVSKLDTNVYIIVDGSHSNLYMSEDFNKMRTEAVFDKEIEVFDDGKVGFSFALTNKNIMASTSVTVDVECEGLEPITLSQADMEYSGGKYQFKLALPEGATSIKATPNITVVYGSEKVDYDSDPVEITDFYFKVDSVVYTSSNKEVVIRFKDLPYEVSANYPVYATINGESAYHYDDYITLSDVEADGEYTITLAQKNRSENLTCFSKTFTFKVSDLTSNSLSFSCPNPGDVDVKYKDKDNATLTFEMNCQNADLNTTFAVVELGSGDEYSLYKTAEDILTINVNTSSSLYIKYYRAFEVDGVLYMFDETYPSGTIDFYGVGLNNISDSITDSTLSSEVTFDNFENKTLAIEGFYIGYRIDGSESFEWKAVEDGTLNGNKYTFTATLPANVKEYYYYITIYDGHNYITLNSDKKLIN